MEEKSLMSENAFSCPIPFNDYPSVLLAHGGGGKLSQQLLQKIISPAFYATKVEPLHDGAVLPCGALRLAYTTDSYVIQPIFFPGGDIGMLAVNGTVNDLAMCGAVPQYLSAAFIIEEGLPMDDLWRIVYSMQNAAAKAGVTFVTGDTKVVNRGKGDKIFITTSGIGIVPQGVSIQPSSVQVGDVIILSGKIAEHGVAIMSVREGLEFETDIVSDTAPLSELVQSMLATTKDIHVLRDPTRGGVASALNEIAEAAHVGIEIEENSIPIRDDVRSACEILGLDPLYVANEGKLLAFVAPQVANDVLQQMRSHPYGKDAAIIGRVIAQNAGIVTLRTTLGSSRIVDMISGEQLPRIC